ncbi:hypothetical protein BABINDRAFT_159133 [Babjeviella inositovora NRRL Y-12698]|uniref:PCI domain-containing protein n=1 Tax=Babjeviella inositovora NRRL Y-12698 TaxID=984486 RepID=A0A1E3QYA5_9ASCO|nr:uncharacterized protein BABINDRAFT_159133 [Babjeviella inositovora NRRL Y-12698]ODQ82574.1 hypothetical protein BABINDRAFT_159133 [Babjeviella inositovora NRRL Y-12698]
MASLRSHIVVDSSISDCVSEYASILSSLQKSTTVEEFVNGDDINEQLFPEVADSVASLGELSDREFEPAFNLAIYILSQAEDSQYLATALTSLIALAPTSKPSIQDKKSLRPTTVISTLSNIFNLLPETSPLRATALKAIITIASQNKIAHILVPLLPHLQNWLISANVNAAEIRQTVFQVARLIEVDEPVKALDLVEKSVTDLAGATVADVSAFVTYALNSVVVDLNYLTSIPVVALVQSTPLYTTLTAYNTGDLAQLKAADVSKATIAKAELLAIAKFLQGKDVVTYGAIAEAIGASADDVELLLIKAIEQQIVLGRLNQATESFTVHKVSALGEFTTEQWLTVQAKLEALKQNLQNIPEIVEQAKKKKGGFVTAHKKVNQRAAAAAAAAAEGEATEESEDVEKFEVVEEVAAAAE